MNYLLLTLGHGSSALFVDCSTEQHKVIGYEQERLSGIKADSQFPIDAINEIEHNVGYNALKGCTIFISHWFNDYTVVGADQELITPCKYITEKDIEKLESYAPTAIHVTNSEFSHHDAHAYSAYAFYDNHKVANQYKPLYCIVADGFGTNEEVLSIYSRRGDKAPELLHRVYGYDASIGIFYQYAAAYVGMKENQDEYKFLGYEAHIDEIISKYDIQKLDIAINNSTQYFISCFNSHTEAISPATNDIIDFYALQDCREYWYTQFDIVLDMFSFEKTSFEARCIIAYYIQQTVERFMKAVVNMFGMDNVCVVGGCFYNVKLNNAILMSISGDFCAMPLAGDQGAAIGMYNYYTGNAFNFGDLCYGKRRMYNAKKLLSNIANAIYVDEAQSLTDEFISKVASYIADNKIVNIVRGNMEFGPRALCNTSTLMLPSVSNVAINNRMNNRNEVMPCAPVCDAHNARKLFDTEELFRTVGSDEYMICTHNYTKDYSKSYGGVMHKKTLDDAVHTGRPQIIYSKNEFMCKLLDKVEELCDAKCLVNTSFNAHGNPIVFDIMDVIRNFKYQCEHIDEQNSPILIVIL